MRATLTAILLAGLTFVLVAALARPRQASSPVELVIWDWWSPSLTEGYRDYFNDLTRQFQERHPGVRLRFQFIPFSNYPQKLTTGFAGSRPPDVFQCSVAWAEGLYDRGVILELNDLVARTPDLAMDQFLPSAVRHNQKNGRIYGIPIILDANCLIYNLDLFEQTGLPTDPYAIDSWETFLEFCRRLTVRDEAGQIVRAGYGLNSYGLSAVIFHPWLYANGGTFYDEATGEVKFHGPEGIEALQFLLRLRDEKVVPAFSPQLDIQEQFIAGKIAMYVDGTWSGKYIERNSEGRARFGMTNFPPGPSGHDRTTVTWANMLMISKACRHPEAAWEFVRFVAGIEGSLLRLKHLGQNSPRKDFYDRPEWLETVKRKPYLAMVREICTSGSKRPSVESKAVESTFGPYFEGLLIYGKTEDVPGRLNDAAEHVGRIYRRAREFYRNGSQTPELQSHGPATTEDHSIHEQCLTRAVAPSHSEEPPLALGGDCGKRGR